MFGLGSDNGPFRNLDSISISVLTHGNTVDRIPSMSRRRPRHPNKEIEAAIRYAESLGWTVEVSNAHAWGYLQCPTRRRGACNVPVWSTPRNREEFARRLIRKIKACDCAETEEDDE